MRETYNKITAMFWGVMAAAILLIETGARPQRLRRANGQTVLEWILIAVAVSIFVFFAYRAIGNKVVEWITTSVLSKFN